MRLLIPLALMFGFSPLALATEEIVCVAFANNQAIQVEQSPAGFWMISVEDPNFALVDVMIDPVTRPGQVRFQLAVFTPPLAVVNLTAGFDPTGLAQAEMRHNDVILYALCEKREAESALQFLK